MTHVYGDPATFADDAVDGFCDLYRMYVRRVPGGVIRTRRAGASKVAVVIGGGSGHYPAFAGYVGAGLADAAAIGDVFAAPPTKGIADLARSVASPAGVLLIFGNYTGDVLNFGAAARQLNDEGIPTVALPVTDDIASARPDAANQRRGIAGDVVVVKIAGAAAEAGYDLAAVERVARGANNQVRSLGLAFGGCTLPGRARPLFTVPHGSMAIGLGIHGEPGISEQPLVDATGLGRVLVDSLLAEQPQSATKRVAVILNGLGGTKYEELFVLWRVIAGRLRDAGLALVAPEAGELVTSLDMAGCSLTLCWLDDELESFWLANADSPAFKRGAAAAPAHTIQPSVAPQPDASWPPSSADSRRNALCLTEMLRAFSDALAAAEEELGGLDARAGDGDHGRSMGRGSAAATQAAQAVARHGGGAASTLAAAADAWAEKAGGTSGALWGIGLRAWSAQLSDTMAVSADTILRGARAALGAVTASGGAAVGDKTLVDVLDPFVEALEVGLRNGASLAESWQAAARRATDAAEATSGLRPRLGRARPLAERSLGYADAGAVSLALCLRVVASELTTRSACREE